MGKFSYIFGISWFLLSLCAGQCCDVLMKLLSQHLHPLQVTFLRYAVGSIILLPFVLKNWRQSGTTARPWLYALRGILLLLAMGLWCLALRDVPLSTASLLGFSVPLFLLPMAKVFLRERVSTTRWLVTFVGFFGVFVAVGSPEKVFCGSCGYLLISAALFASLDVLNRKFAQSEKMLANLFYTSAATALFAIFPACQLWQPVAHSHWLPIICLSLCAHFLLFCLIRAFRLVEASAAAPYRYVEFFLSIASGYIVFAEHPLPTVLVGACITIPATVLLARLEMRAQC
ncbi:MAG: DMT family transporter [Puniceicoccales bacterium]|jgi:S-adenosylmethionine uptake transporter|nr:DMT family transporter [Puniceicoccales bacterium]